MTDKEIRTPEMFKRLRGFGAAHADRFAPKSLALELFHAVNEAASELCGINHP